MSGLCDRIGNNAVTSSWHDLRRTFATRLRANGEFKRSERDFGIRTNSWTSLYSNGKRPNLMFFYTAPLTGPILLAAAFFAVQIAHDKAPITGINTNRVKCRLGVVVNSHLRTPNLVPNRSRGSLR